jgi:hypothetical protein
VLRRCFAVVAANLIVFAVLAEAAGLVLYYTQTGGLFYLHRRPYTPIPETSRGALTADALHPYFGPTHRPGHPFSLPGELAGAKTAAAATNNFGFVAAVGYPYYRRTANELLIGIFGGSVGLWFCQLGADRLVQQLKASEPFTRRDIVPLCFAHEGYKQPQQALVLSYFLSIGQEFDLVVNIDGFNEVALGAWNDREGLDLSMPSAMHVQPLINLIDQATLTPEKLESLAAIGGYKRRLNAAAERINGNRSAAVNLVFEQYYRFTRQRLVSEQFRFAALPSNPARTSVMYVTPRTRPREGSKLFDDIAALWVASSALMQDLLAARSARYLHVLQPNQYYTQRRFTDAEARVALNPGSPFRAAAISGYPVLVRAAADRALQRRGIAFLDATRVFDGEPAAVYADDCCHYTVRGNELLADAIARAILGRL